LLWTAPLPALLLPPALLPPVPPLTVPALPALLPPVPPLTVPALLPPEPTLVGAGLSLSPSEPQPPRRAAVAPRIIENAKFFMDDTRTRSRAPALALYAVPHRTFLGSGLRLST
jgi:hypothetical protein